MIIKCKTFEEMKSYVTQLTNGNLNKTFIEGFVCGVGFDGGITQEVEDKLFQWIDSLPGEIEV